MNINCVQELHGQIGNKKPTGDALVTDVLAGKTFSTAAGYGLTGTIPTQTLSAANDTVAAGYYEATTLSAVDTDLAAANIKKDAVIFGITGAYEGGGGTTINGTRTLSIGTLAENIDAGDIVSVTAIGAIKTANPNSFPSSLGSFTLAVSADGQLLAMGNNTAPRLRSYKWSAINNRFEVTTTPDVDVPASMYGVAMSADGLYVAAVHGGTTTNPKFMSYKWVEANNRYEMTALPDSVPSGIPANVAMSGDGMFVAIGHPGTTAPVRLATYKWSSANNRYEATAIPDFVVGGTPSQIGISNDGGRMIVGHTSATGNFFTAFNWSSANNRYEITSTVSPIFSFSSTAGCAMSSDGSRVVQTSSPTGVGTLRNYDWSSANNRYELAGVADWVPDSPGKLAMTRNGNTLIVLISPDNFLNSGGFLIYKWSSANSRYEINAQPDILFSGTGNAAALSDDGAIMALGGGGAPYLSSYSLPASIQYSISKKINPPSLSAWSESHSGFLATTGTTGQIRPVTVTGWTRNCFGNDLDPV